MRTIMHAAFAALALLFFAMTAIPAVAAPVATFTYVDGKVDLTPPGGRAQAVGKGGPVNVGDVIRVKSKSRAEVTFNDSNVLRLAANTRLKVTRYMFGKEINTDERLDLYRGKIKAIVNTAIKASGQFEVHTPTAVAGVRGTQYFIGHAGGQTSVAVTEGSVFVAAVGMPGQLVNAGQSATVGAGQRVVVYPSPQFEIQQLEKETAPGTQQGQGGGQVTNSLFGQNSTNNLLSNGQVNVIIPFTEVPPPVPDITSSLPVPVTGDHSIGFAFTPEPNVVYAYRSDGGEWTATSGPEINLSNLEEGLHIFELRAAGLGGSSTVAAYRWFVGDTRYTVDGLVTGSLSGVVDTVNSQGLRLLSTGYTGAWAINSYSSVPAMSVPSSLSLVAGGTNTGPEGRYWISRVSAISSGSTISGSSSLTSINPLQMGGGAGIVSGLITPDALGYYDWALVDYGLSYTEYDLSFYNAFSPATRYLRYDDGYGVITDGSLNMHMGGLGSPWTSPSVSFSGLGQYSPGVSGWSTAKTWKLVATSHNYTNDSDMTYDGGAYRGYLAGIAQPVSSTVSLEGNASLLYVDNTAGAHRMGILTGSLSGTGYPGLGMAEFLGSLQRVDLGASPVEPEALAFGSQTFSHSSGSGAFTLNGVGTQYGISYVQPAGYVPMEFMYITGASNAGVFQAEVNAGYDTPGVFNGWYLDVYGPLPLEKYSGLALTGLSWADGRLSAAAAGYWADIESAIGSATGIIGGRARGTYNTTQLTFQTAITGTWMETNRFLSMTDTGSSPNVASLQALNIPCFEVGRATLSGTNGLSNVTLSNVIFLAGSTGAAPSIWATGSVSGVNQVGTALSVPVSGNGLSATFQMREWLDLAGSGTWLATVNNGSGSIAGGGANVQNLQFNGAAAGSFSGSVNFSGTAAGTVRQGGP